MPARSALRVLVVITLAVSAVGCGTSAPTSGPASATIATSTPTIAPTLTPSPATGSAPPSPSPSVQPSASSPSATTAAPAAPRGLLLFLREEPGEGTFNRSAWVVPSKGGPARSLGPATEASWSADGRLVHLVRLNAKCVPRLRTVTPEGKVVSEVKSVFRAGDGAFAWSPDGRRVVFLRYHNGAPPSSCGPGVTTVTPNQTVRDIMVMYANGVGKRVLMARVWPLRPLSWSSDGSRIAVARSTRPINESHQVLDLVQVPGGTVTNLAGKPGSPSLEGLSPPTWSPDSTHLASTVYKLTSHAMVAAVDGTGLRDLGSGTTSDYEPGWAPDSDHVAVAYDKVKNGTIVGGGMSIRSIDGANVRDLGLNNVQVDAGPPSWSPAGDRIAYVRTVAYGSAGPGRIVVVWPDGSHPRVLAGTGAADWVAWQPSP
jgi:Tol biopolymer transport system component